MKLVAYIRISSHGQKDKGDSLDGQRQYIKSWALTGKHTIKKWYIDEAVSAFKGKRLNFELMLDELDSGLVQADAVIVYSLSRFSRNLVTQLNATKTLEKLGMSLLSASESLPNSPDDKYLVVTMLGLINEHQSRQNSRVVSDRLRDTARKGFYTGGPIPFGYNAITVSGDTSKKRKKLVVNHQESPVVKLIFELAEKGTNGKGFGVKNIAVHLNKNGYSNRGKKWNKNSVCNILNNRVYMGEFLFGKSKPNKLGDERIVVKVPSIVSSSKFERVRQYVEERALSNTGIKSARSNSLLTGVLTCPICHGSMRVTHGKSGKYKYYQCSQQVMYSPDSCSFKRIRKEEADKLIIESLINRIFTEQNLSEIYLQTRNLLKERVAKNRMELTSLSQRIGSEKSRANHLIELISEHKIEATKVVSDTLKKHSDQIAHLEEELARKKISSSLPVKNFGMEKIKQFTHDVHSYIKKADEASLKQLILATIDKVYTIPEKKKLTFTVVTWLLSILSHIQKRELISQFPLSSQSGGEIGI
ncbi:recombinase family protein [Vibrio parahaemolyticus]|nr:recombinase family protein [Vibrio parahaemolyticus]